MLKTYSLENILPLVIPAEAEQVLRLYHDGLHEMVSFGTLILDHELKNEQATNTLITIIMFFRRVIELTDAIANLIKLGITDPSEILLRSLFETTLGLEYLLKDDTERRALAYQYCDYARHRQLLARHKPDHPNYKNYSNDYKHGLFHKEVPVVPDLDRKIAEADEWLCKAEYEEIKNEYESRKASQNDPKWYSLFNGPEKSDKVETVQKLAKYLGKFDIYELFYKEWSNPSHGTKLGIDNVFRVSEDTIGVLSLRNSTKAHQIAILTARIGGVAFDCMAEHIKTFDSDFWLVMGEWAKNYDKDYIGPMLDTKIEFEL